MASSAEIVVTLYGNGNDCDEVLFLLMCLFVCFASGSFSYPPLASTASPLYTPMLLG